MRRHTGPRTSKTAKVPGNLSHVSSKRVMTVVIHTNVECVVS